MKDGHYEVGDPIVFTPFAFTLHKEPGMSDKVNGRVIFVHEEHRYFVAAGKVNGAEVRESYKF